MTKLCQRYISDVKYFFPVLGTPEKKYLAKLTQTIEDYCIEEKVTTIDEIYNGLGHPREVVNSYLAQIDTSKLIKRIQFIKWIRRGLFVFLLISLIAVSIYGISTYKAYKILEQDKIYFEESEIID